MVMQMPSWRHEAAQGLWRLTGIMGEVKRLEKEEQLRHEQKEYRNWQKDLQMTNLAINAASQMKAPGQKADFFNTFSQKYKESGNESMSEVFGMLAGADEEDMVAAKKMTTEMATILEDPTYEKLIAFEAKYPNAPKRLVERAYRDLLRREKNEEDDAKVLREQKEYIANLQKEGFEEVDPRFIPEDLDREPGRTVPYGGKTYYKRGKKIKEEKIKGVKVPTFDALLGKLQGLRKKRADYEAKITQMGYEYKLTPSVEKARKMIDTSIAKTENLMKKRYPSLWKDYQGKEKTEIERRTYKGRTLIKYSDGSVGYAD